MRNKHNFQNSSFFLCAIASCLFLLLIPRESAAQLNVAMRGEYQAGNEPGVEPGNRTNLYNQLNLRYSGDGLALGARIETFYVDGPAEYQRLSQLYGRYSVGDWRVQAGHFYEILGRGLLLRGYEVPGTTFEDGASRQRYAFFKDIEGLSVRYQGDLISAKMLSGRPLDFSAPPMRKKQQRRPSLVHGGEVNVNVAGYATPGILYLRSDTDGNVMEYAGANFSGYLGQTQYYAEYVQNSSPRYDLLKFGEQSPHAFYGSISQTLGSRASLTLEYKDYNDFNLVFNEAPQLVRQHSYTLLNRATHNVEPSNEKGYQAELLVNIGGPNTVTLNNSYAQNDFGSSLLIFREYYADINLYLTDELLVKAFADFSEDDLFLIRDRYTGGIAVEQTLGGLWSINGELQQQWFDRDYGNPQFDHSAQNQLASVTLSYAPDFSVSLLLERSNDPLENDRLGQNLEFDYWPAISVLYRFNGRHDLGLFYGKRRGGNACTGGICYEVLPFEGLELTWNSRL